MSSGVSFTHNEQRTYKSGATVDGGDVLGNFFGGISGDDGGKNAADYKKYVGYAMTAVEVATFVVPGGFAAKLGIKFGGKALNMITKGSKFVAKGITKLHKISKM